MNAEVAEAFANTDRAYLKKLLDTRHPTRGIGSRFLSPMTLTRLMAADWRSYKHREVKGPARAFRAAIPGRLGIRRLSKSDDFKVLLLDPKGTGFVEGVVRGKPGEKVGFTVLLVGPHPESKKTVVWTVFPGEPVAPSRVKAAGLDGMAVSARQAYDLGIRYVKVSK